MNIRVRNLAFSYKDFSLRVGELLFEAARVTSIVGPNGAGKRPCSNASGHPACAQGLRVRRRPGFCHAEEPGQGQAPELCSPGARLGFQLSGAGLRPDGEGLLYLALRPAVQGGCGAAEEALEFVGLGRYAARAISELSSGERRLALIARSLAQESTVLLMDEPTTFLDPRHEKALLDLVRKLAVEKKETVVVTLHGLEMAVQYSDEMVFMKGGEVVASGPPGDVFREPLLESVYGMKIRIVDFEGRKIVIR